MENALYASVEAIVSPRMRHCMVALHTYLQSSGFVVDSVEAVDHDEERGVGFAVHLNRDQGKLVAIEFLLADGDQRGFGTQDANAAATFGLCLTACTDDARVLHQWAPYNGTSMVGTDSVDELLARISLLEPINGIGAIVADSIREYHRNVVHPAARPRGD